MPLNPGRDRSKLLAKSWSGTAQDRFLCPASTQGERVTGWICLSVKTLVAWNLVKHRKRGPFRVSAHCLGNENPGNRAGHVPQSRPGAAQLEAEFSRLRASRDPGRS